MQDRLKILMGMDAYFPNVDGVVNCMHNYLVNLTGKNDVLAIVPKAGKETGDFPYPIRRFNSIKIPFYGSYSGIPQLDKKFKRDIYRQNFDIVHVHSPFNMMKFALSYAKEKNIPAVATFHSNMRPIFQKIFKNDAMAEKVVQNMGKMYNRFDEVFVCSEKVAEQARSFGYTGKFTYLPFGTNMARPADLGPLKREFEERYDVGEDELIFLFVGRIVKLKRIDFILDALKICRERGLKFRFFLAGDGMDFSYHTEYAKKAGLADICKFCGFVPDVQMPSLYARADLFLFPSLYDNFGLVKVDAAAHETPGVFIRDSNAAYDIADGENGFLADNTPEAFAGRILEAVADRGRLKAIGKTASRTLYTTWAQATALLENEYRRIYRGETECRSDQERHLESASRAGAPTCPITATSTAARFSTPPSACTPIAPSSRRTTERSDSSPTTTTTPPNTTAPRTSTSTGTFSFYIRACIIAS